MLPHDAECLCQLHLTIHKVGKVREVKPMTELSIKPACLVKLRTLTTHVQHILPIGFYIPRVRALVSHIRSTYAAHTLGGLLQRNMMRKKKAMSVNKSALRLIPKE